MPVLICPFEYTTNELGNFKQWVWGPIYLYQLNFKKLGNPIVVINDVVFHCLIFESAAAGCNNYARWDSINGWTTTLKEAKKRWPQGLHGKCIPGRNC